MLMKFGRIYKPDDRDKQYPIMHLVSSASKPRSYTWKCYAVLDQGEIPACTGFAAAHEAAARPAVIKNITNIIGLETYLMAQELDDIPGTDYEGSTIRGAAKAAVKKGWFKEYRWANGVDDLILAIGYKGPAILGINWKAGMSIPDTNNIIHAEGSTQGGHAILCNGVNIKKRLFRLHNSWGKHWGLNGEAFISFDDMQMLLKNEGEACIPIARIS
jgi:hypothetical protein